MVLMTAFATARARFLRGYPPQRMTSRSLLAAAAAVALLAGCGDDPAPAPAKKRPAAAAKKPVKRSEQPACDVFKVTDVARVVQRTTGKRLEDIGRPNVERTDSDETSSCGWYAGPHDDVAIKVTIDGALNPAKRYWYRVTELNQRADNWSGPRPRLVFHVGQDKSYGGAGAFWNPSQAKLVAFRDEKMVTVIFFVPGVGDRESSAAAAGLARLVYRRLFGDKPPAPPHSLADRQPHP
jgi:hypothetical protein